MRNSSALILGLLILTAFVLSDSKGNATPEMAQYFVGLIYRGPNSTSEVTPEVEKIQAAHRANIGRLVATGQMAMAGPFGDDGDLRGLFFYNVETMEEAQALVESDPAVKIGRLRVELHPWWGPAKLATLLNEPEAEKN